MWDVYDEVIKVWDCNKWEKLERKYLKRVVNLKWLKTASGLYEYLEDVRWPKLEVKEMCDVLMTCLKDRWLSNLYPWKTAVSKRYYRWKQANWWDLSRDDKIARAEWYIEYLREKEVWDILSLSKKEKIIRDHEDYDEAQRVYKKHIEEMDRLKYEWYKWDKKKIDMWPYIDPRYNVIEKDSKKRKDDVIIEDDYSISTYDKFILIIAILFMLVMIIAVF